MHQEQNPQPKVARHSLSETVIAPRRFKLGGFCLLAGAAAFWLWASPAAAECYMDTPSGYQGMGGGGRIGPYPSRSACESVSSQYFGGQGSCSCTSSGSSSGGSDQHQWEEQQQRQRERERKRREFEEAERKAREQEEARRRQFEQSKQNALDLLKSGSNDLSLKGAGTGDMGLKGGSGQPLKLRDAPASDLSLKEPLFSKGHQGSAPPDLSDFDPKWPIVVDLKQVQGQNPQALRRANLTTHALLDALAAGRGDWRESIRFLQDKLKAKPGDAILTDALNLVRGYYNGYLGIKEVSDNYYKYGVRQWLEGDFDGAARAFARAYREYPDDTLLFKSFAHTLGLRDASGKCGVAYTCSHIDIPRRSLVDELHIRETMESNLEEARLALSVDPANPELRAGLNYLEGLVGYHDWLESEPDQTQEPFDKRTWMLTSEGLERLAKSDYAGAFQAFAQASEGKEDDRGILFAMSYARGLGAAQQGGADVPDALWDERTTRVYEEWAKEIDAELVAQLFMPAARSTGALTRQVKDAAMQNPFFGLLSDEDVERLRQGDESLFR